MKYIDNLVFEKIGYIQEINRMFLNPIGLSMTIVDNNIKILDCRDIKEGVTLRLDEQAKAKSQLVLEDYHNRKLYRIKKYGWSVQPLEEKE